MSISLEVSETPISLDDLKMAVFDTIICRRMLDDLLIWRKKKLHLINDINFYLRLEDLQCAVADDVMQRSEAIKLALWQIRRHKHIGKLKLKIV
jgi:hypothetical protein